MSDSRAVSSPWAVTSLIASMGLVALGNGLLFSYIPVKLAAVGFPPWIAGAILTSMSGGGLAGCLLAGFLVRRVGHARVFASMGALLVLSILLIAIGALPLLWVISRFVYGFAVTGLFIVTQSWLNDAVENDWRGKIIAIFYMTYVLCIGAGSYILAFVDLQGAQAPLLSIFFAAAAILPVGLTRLDSPPPPETVTVNLMAVWRISPVGLVGLLAVGGLTLLVQGFAPIYAAAEGYGKDEIGLLLFLMQFGMIAIQLPLGALSDRIDRRYVLVMAAAIVVFMALFASQASGVQLIWLIVIFGVWAGATETIYAVANAHTNDRAEPQYYVAVSSTLLVAWSLSGVVLPGFATLLTGPLGPGAFMYVAATIAALYGLFVLYRLTRREPAAAGEQEPYQPVTGQAPLPPEMAPLSDEPQREPD